MHEELKITSEKYKKSFQLWCEAIMTANSINGRKPITKENHDRPNNPESIHGSKYAYLLPHILEEFQKYNLSKHGTEQPILIYCDAIKAWLSEFREIEVASGHDDPSIIAIDVTRSSLLARLIYDQETFRTRPCPIHNGRWSGLRGGHDGGCHEGCDLTGWLPEGMSKSDIIERFRERRQYDIERIKQFIKNNPKSPFTHESIKNPEIAYEEYKIHEAKRLGIKREELDNLL